MQSFDNPRLLRAEAFAREATKSIKRAKSRIAIVMTTFHSDDELSSTLIEELCDASARGVKVTVCADSYTYTEPKEFLLRSPKKHPVRAYRALKIERKLKKCGVEYRWLGRTSNFGFAGRTHTKWVIADDDVFSFGGVNIDHTSFTNTDYMLHFNDNELANMLYAEHQRLVHADRAGHASKSHKLVVNQTSTLLIDGGLPGDSVIYRRACTLAKEASSIIFVSQYCPTGKLNRILKRKKATLYFNHWRQAKWMNMVMIRFGMMFARQDTGYNRRQYLHAKFIIFTMAGGEKIAITGSHNYMYGSVILGTREIALETSDSVIISQLENFLAKHVK